MEGDRGVARTSVDFRSIFESAPGRYLVLDPQLTIVAVSDAYLRATMTERAAIVGRALFDVFPDNPADGAADGVSNLAASLARVLRDRVADRMPVQKYDVRDPDGVFQERYWCPENVPVLSSTGEVERIVHSVEDVTERHLAERGLRAANGFLDTIIDSIPDVVFVKDATSLAYTRINRAAEQLFGVARAQAIGLRVGHFIGADAATDAESRDRALLASDASIAVIEELVPTTRGPRWFRKKSVVVRDEDGGARHLLGISEDITERREQEEARLRLASIVASSQDAIVGKSLEGIITTWNRGAEEIFGYAADEVVGRSATLLLPADRGDEDASMLAKIRAGESVGSFESRRRCKDGREVDVSVTSSQIRSATGELIGMSTITRDISELKRTQARLVRAKEEVEAANRELEAFSDSVAHDLRAPLRAIDGFSQALVEDFGGTLTEPALEYLGLVRASATHMAHLIDDLLKLSKLNRASFERAPVDVSALAHASIARLRRAHTGRSVEVTIADDITASGDAALLAIAIDNLIGNAWKFTRGRRPAHIEVGVDTARTPAVYFVHDDGAGFDMAYASKLFGVFQRLHSVSEFEGTGIGLATVHRIVHRHGGRVWAEGAVDRGATFFFTLSEEGATP